jgi:hypothetical protein
MTIKQCVICQSEFDIKGKAITCSSECRTIRYKRYQQKYQLTYQPDYYVNNKVKLLAGMMVYQSAHHDEIFENERKWRAKHKDFNVEKRKVAKLTYWRNKYTVTDPLDNYKKMMLSKINDHYDYVCWHCKKQLTRDSRVNSHVALCLDCMTMTDLNTGQRFNGRVELKITKKCFKHMQAVKASRSRVDGAVVGMGHIL